MSDEPISETLRSLLDDYDGPLTRVAADAGVDYQRLYRWFNYKTETLDVDVAEAVYKTLTGKTFVRA